MLFRMLRSVELIQETFQNKFMNDCKLSNNEIETINLD